MIADMKTVIWKESKSIFRMKGRKSQAILSLLMPILLAIYLPWDGGTAWTAGALSLIPCILVPFIFVGTTIPDSFAGERERHTLSTLLASRLSDGAILYGKILISVFFGWALVWLVLIIGLLVVNLTSSSDGFLFYSSTALFANLSISLLISLIAAGAGVLISLRSSAVQEAQQMLMMILIAPILVVQVGGVIILSSDAARGQLREFFSGIEYGNVVLILFAILTLLATGLQWWAKVRFKRDRMILTT
jgi:ABC-2 type transport system permease protein